MKIVLTVDLYDSLVADATGDSGPKILANTLRAVAELSPLCENAETELLK